MNADFSRGLKYLSLYLSRIWLCFPLSYCSSSSSFFFLFLSLIRLNLTLILEIRPRAIDDRIVRASHYRYRLFSFFLLLCTIREERILRRSTLPSFDEYYKLVTLEVWKSICIPIRDELSIFPKRLRNRHYPNLSTFLATSNFITRSFVQQFVRYSWIYLLHFLQISISRLLVERREYSEIEFTTQNR